MHASIKAVALISGGLDSMLAAKTIMQQGIHVEGINFFTGFCVEGHTHAIRKRESDKPKRNNALWVAEQLGIQLHFIDVIEEYKPILIQPKHGYGANLNPCLDCKIFMVSKAKQWMLANDFDFMITGEVIGQRPMSQRKATMPIVAAESGADDLLVRPLCAQNLPPTLPERKGWIKRELLHNFSGRSRKPQIELAHQFGFNEFSQPAGGCCFLTDAQYSQKLKDLWQNRGHKEYELDDIMLLKVGRHLRPNVRFKIIIAREEGETQFLNGYKKQFIHLYNRDHQGPLALIDGQPNAEDLQIAARLVARYGQGRNLDQVEIMLHFPNQPSQSLSVNPFIADHIPQEWFI